MECSSGNTQQNGKIEFCIVVCCRLAQIQWMDTSPSSVGIQMLLWSVHVKCQLQNISVEHVANVFSQTAFTCVMYEPTQENGLLSVHIVIKHLHSLVIF